MSPEEEPRERERIDGPEDAAAAAAKTPDAERGHTHGAGEAGLGGGALPRREPAARQAPLAAPSPRLSLEQLAELRERLARLKAGHEPSLQEGEKEG